MLKIRGYEIKEPVIKDSFNRRAMRLKNDIIETLRGLGVSPDHITIELEPMPIKKAPATVKWYFEGHNLQYSHGSLPKFIDNLYVVNAILGLEATKLLNKEISVDEFCYEFKEEGDIKQQRIEARVTLGVDPDEKDFEVITKKFKQLAKEHHPDMPTGNPDTFKKINQAHKILKRELV